jgi:hypothetical protein
MLYAIIGARLHGILDEVVAAVYVLGAYVLGLHGAALGVALGGASVHFLLTRFTDYPEGTWKVIPFRVHAFIELGEGLLVLSAVAVLLGASPPATRGFLAAMGASQFAAFGFSDYGPRRRT